MTTALRHPGKVLAAAFTVAIVAALVLSGPLGSPAGAQSAEPPDPRGVSFACPANEVPTQFPYSDVNDDTFRAEIACLAYYDITRGYPDGTYRPGNLVPRDQMASFFARLLDYAARAGAAQELPPYVSNRFADVPGNSTHVEAINRLADAGIIQGGPADLPDNHYGPSLAVTRAQMASFVARVQQRIGTPFTANASYFPDLAGTEPHTGNINAVAEQGIAVGDAAGRFNPFAATTRQQMSAFVMRHADANVAADALVTPAVAAAAALDVEPAESATLELQDGEGDHREYTLTNPVAGEEHIIALVDAGQVSANRAGVAAFAAGTDNAAEGLGDVDADIVEVNGGAPDGGAGGVVSVTPGGTAPVTFVVDGVGAESLRPVVFVDENGDGDLNVNGDGRPVAEVYGVGGVVTYQDDPVEPPPPPDDVTIEGADVSRDGGVENTLDAGDDFTLTFSGDVPGSATAKLFFSDGDGTTGSVTCGPGPCAYDSITTTLTVEMQGNPGTSGGSQNGLQYPVTVTALRDPVSNAELIDAAGSPPLQKDSGTERPATPTVTSVSPTSGPAGTPVTIAGTNFAPGDVRVFFGAVRAPDPVVTEDEIEVLAPAQTEPGTVQVSVESHRIPSSSTASYTYP